MARLEQLFGPTFRGQPTFPGSQSPNAGLWSGRAQINSNAASVTVNATMVQSDSLIFAFPQKTTAANSGFARALCVSTIAPGSSFIISTVDGQPIISSDVVQVMWFMVKIK